MGDKDTPTKARFAVPDSDLPPRPGGVQLRPRRSPRLIALGVLCACLGGLGSAYLYMNSTTSQQVLVMARLVHRGQVIQPNDITITTIGAAPGVAVTEASELDSLIGQSALVDLPAGALVGPNAIGPAVPPPGKAQIGLKLSPGRVPASPIQPGTKVILVRLDEAKKDETGFPAEVAHAPTEAGQGEALLLDVWVDAASAPLLANLAANDHLALIRGSDD